MGNGNGLVVRPSDVKNLSDANTLEIQGDSSNHVYLLAGWTETSDQVVGSVTYHSYASGSSQLLLQDGIVATIQTAVPAGAEGFDPAPYILPPMPNPAFLATDVTVVDFYDMLYPLIIFSNETWESDNGGPVINNEGFTLTNYGTIESVTNSHAATAVATPSTGGGQLENYGHIIASTTETLFAADAIGADYEEGVVDNFGTIDAYTISGSATGIRSYAPEGVITNNGKITVQSDAISNNPNGHLAVGVWLEYASLVNNGVIDATGAGAAAVLLEIPSFQMTNTGTITATSTQGFESIGMLGGYLLNNSGTIKADIAVKSLNFDVQNTGLIQGDFDGNEVRFDPITHYDDTINNSGTIVGTVYFGLDEDTYDGREGTITGTVFGQDGDDTLLGGAGNEVFDGGAGNDTLNGGGGSDTASYEDATGGVNVNLINSVQAVGGGAGTDTLISIENLTGSNFDDVLRGNSGNNVVSGLGGNDTINLWDGGNDTALGGDGNDTFNFGGAFTAADTVDGGAGTDTLILNGDYSAGLTFAATSMVNVEQIRLFPGYIYNLTLNDANVAAGQTMTVNAQALGASHALIFDGSQETNGNFILQGGAGNDVLKGGAGTDTFFGGAGNDTLNGGNGIDTANYSAATSGVNVNLSLSTAQAVGGGQGSDTLISIENLVGSNFDDVLQGNSSNNTLNGGSGNDTVSYAAATSGVSVNLALSTAQAVGGGEGSDTLLSIENLTGSNFNDVLQGNSGDNTLNGGGGSDTVSYAAATSGVNVNLALSTAQAVGGGQGNDTLISIENVTGSNFDDVLQGNGGNNTLNGGGGSDTVSYVAATAGVSVNLALSTAQAVGGGQGNDTLISIENVTGSNFNDVLHGTSGDNILSGLGGNDTLDLSAGGNDTAVGGDGDDTINFGATFTAADRIDGGTGNDVVTLNGDYSTGVTFAAQTMVNVETIQLAAGHSYNLTTDNATVAAGQTLTVRAASLGAGDTFIFNGAHETNGNFIIYGGAGNDAITGGSGNDTITDGAGNDIITGGMGADHLTGGLGADTLVYANAAQSTGPNYDMVSGFDFAGGDKFDLNVAVSAIDAKIASGALSVASFDSDLAIAVDKTHLGKHDAILFTPDSGDLAGKTFLIVDANGTAGYQPGKDYVILLDHAAHLSSIDVTDFI